MNLWTESTVATNVCDVHLLCQQPDTPDVAVSLIESCLDCSNSSINQIRLQGGDGGIQHTTE